MISYFSKPNVILSITLFIVFSLPALAQETTKIDKKATALAIGLPGGNPTMPPSVSPVTVPSTSNGDFTVSWNNVGAQSYEIYMSSNGGSTYAKLWTLGSGYSSYSVNNYGAGTYRFRVTACNSTNRYYCSHAYSNNVTVKLPEYTVSARVDGAGGSVSPSGQVVQKGKRATITVNKNTGYKVNAVTGCNGSLNGEVYTTGTIASNCSITARFKKKTFSATSVIKVENGDVTPFARVIEYQKTGEFILDPDPGYRSSSVIGCPGQLNGNTFITAPMTASCYLNPQFVKVVKVVTDITSGGTISPATRTLDAGGVVTFTVTPSSGYEIDSVSGCQGAFNAPTYTTGVLNHSCTVRATFVRKVYRVSTDIGAGGTISPATAVVNAGERLSLAVTPNVGYQVSGVNGCGVTQNGSSYTTSAMTRNCTVSATFKRKTYRITASSAGSGGTVSPAQVVLNHGEKQTFQITANDGYRILSNTGCWGNTGAGNLYTTGAITGECSVTSRFQKTYKVTASANSGGAVTPQSKIVDAATTVPLTITPAEGYRVLSATGCSGDLNGNTYTTGPVSSNCAVNVVFKLDTTERRVVFIHTDLQGSVAAESDENGNVH